MAKNSFNITLEILSGSLTRAQAQGHSHILGKSLIPIDKKT